MPNGTAELTPEELDATKAYGYSPPAAPEARLPNPVVPLPMRVPQRFIARSAPASYNPMEDIRTQINAMQFKTAQEALDASERFQYMRAFQRDIDAGVAPEKALLRWGPGLFKKTPNVIPGIMRENRMGAPPQALNVPGVPAGVLAQGRPFWPPAGSIPKPPLSTNVTTFTVPGATNVLGYGVQSGPQTRRFIPAAKPTALTPDQQQRALRAAINDAKKELDDLPTDTPSARRTELQNDIKAWGQQRKALLPGAASADPAVPIPLPKAKNELKKDTVYQTTRGPAKWDGEKFVKE